MSRFARALVIGDAGGIGAAMAALLRERGVDVTGLSRRSDPPIDLTDETSIDRAMGGLEGPFDLVFVATGLLHDAVQQPEKNLRMMRQDALARAFAVNATGPALAIRHALRHVPRDMPAVIAALSARVGSIGDNRLGGWHAYRASKAALNMLIKTMSVELARTHGKLAIVALHPGTVDTKLSQPFQSSVPDEQLFTTEQSALYLLGVMEGLGPERSGEHIDWAGKRIAP